VDVVEYLKSLGFTVLQVGRYKHEQVADEINTSSIRFLKFVISSCDLFIGVDSSPAHIAVAYNKACVIMCGSVNPKLIYPDLTNVEIIQQPCDHAFCWHTKSGSSEGVPCFYAGTEKEVQCSNYDSQMIISAIDKFIFK
jgi:ADP-heptose:LPS heptosyltransferase